MTLPIILHFFYEFPVYSIILNLIVLPLLSFLAITATINNVVPSLSSIKVQSPCPTSKKVIVNPSLFVKQIGMNKKSNRDRNPLFFFSYKWNFRITK